MMPPARGSFVAINLVKLSKLEVPLWFNLRTPAMCPRLPAERAALAAHQRFKASVLRLFLRGKPTLPSNKMLQTCLWS